MSKAKEVKCRFAHCKHPDDKLPPDQMVKDGTMYYHEECLKVKNDMARIRILYKSLDPNVIMSFLNKMINEAVFEKNIPTEDIIFALEYFQKTKKQIKSPAQLLYIPYYREVQRAKQTKEKPKKINFNGKCDSLGTESTAFTYKPTEEKKGFSKIIKKG